MNTDISDIFAECFSQIPQKICVYLWIKFSLYATRPAFQEIHQNELR